MPTSLHLYRAKVIDTNDPQAAGRVRVTVPTTVNRKPATLDLWVVVASMPLGSLFSSLPTDAVGDEVVVAAERLPSSGAVVVGCSKAAPPVPPAPSSVMIGLPNGQQLTLTADAAGVSVTGGNGGATVRMGTDGSVEVIASSVRIVAATRVELEGGEVVVNAGIGKFSGIVQCDTLIANAVISASYSPGAGNVW